MADNGGQVMILQLALPSGAGEQPRTCIPGTPAPTPPKTTAKPAADVEDADAASSLLPLGLVVMQLAAWLNI
jgi:hypothetical protein